MCEFVVNSFPFEIIMMGTAARRAGEPFVQQFLDKHSRAVLAFPSPLRLISSSGHANAVPLFPGGRRLCLRRPPRYALFLRQATQTRPEISRADAAFVGVPLPAAPCFFASPRQHRPLFSGRTPPLLVSPSPLRLIPPPRHANTTGNILTCWRIWVLENKKAG